MQSHALAHSWPEPGNGAGVVLEFLAPRKIACCAVYTALQNDEAGESFFRGRPDYDQRLLLHVLLSAWHFAGKKFEGIHVKLIARHTSRQVMVANTGEIQRRPGIANRRRTQRLADILA